jgi:uncharacterized lipoprotein YajG
VGEQRHLPDRSLHGGQVTRIVIGEAGVSSGVETLQAPLGSVFVIDDNPAGMNRQTLKVLALGTVLLGACSFAPIALIQGLPSEAQFISLSYRSQSPVKREPNAETVVVGVTVQDQRDIKDKVAGQTNYAGAEVAALRSTTDIPGLVGRSIKAEITHRGFNLGSGGVTVVTNLWRFYNYFDGNAATGDANSEVDFDVYVYKPGRPRVGQHLYYRHLHGVGIKPINFHVVDSGKAALEEAFTNAMNQLLGDHRFFEALLRAAPPPATSTPRPTPSGGG